jgi:hypothetical protein
MKIYCILFDMVPINDDIKNLIESKGLHYSDFIANSWTSTTLSTMFSGVTPSELYPRTGIGYEAGYKTSSDIQKQLVDSKMIFNNLPNDWNIHIHAMGPTRGDIVPVLGSNTDLTHKFRFIPDDICSIRRHYNTYTYEEGRDEQEFVSQMQKLDNKENHFIFLKYNEYHDAKSALEKFEALSIFKEIIKSINFKEKNSLFWLFSDHGEFKEVDKYMKPPHSWLSWCSVTDNITNRKVTKDVIYMTDFYNTVLNRINYKKSFTQETEYRRLNSNLGDFDFPDDVLHKFNMHRIYVCEDGRSAIDKYMSTTATAIKKINTDMYCQGTVHRLDSDTSMIFNVYDKVKKIKGPPQEFMTLEEIDSVCAHLLTTLSFSRHWRWYFE